MFQPTSTFIYFALFDHQDAPTLTQTFGTALCKLLVFFINTSYGVSMSSLVVITVHRFYAEVFPMRARLEGRGTRALLLVCTWLLPMAVHSQPLYYSTFNSQRRECSLNMRGSRRLIWDVTFLVPFVALPFLLLFVLHVPRDYCQVSKTEGAGKLEFSLARQKKKTKHPFNTNVHHFNCSSVANLWHLSNCVCSPFSLTPIELVCFTNIL